MPISHGLIKATLLLTLFVWGGIASAAPREQLYGKNEGYPSSPTMRGQYTEANRVGGFSGKRVLQTEGVSRVVNSPWSDAVNLEKRNVDWGFIRDPAALLKNNSIMALLLIRDGKIVFEDYQYETSRKSHFNSESITKTLTALAIGRLVQDGLVDMETTVDTYVDEFKGKWFGRNTIKTLLKMQCGISGVGAGSTGGPYASLKFGNTMSYGPSVNLYDYFANVISQQAVPGRDWEYDPRCSDALSMVVSRVSGKNLGEYFQEKFFSVLKNEYPAYWTKAEKTDIVSGANQFWASSADWAKLAILLANKGTYKDMALVPEKWIDSMLADATRTSNKSRFMRSYGYQVWVDESAPGAGLALGFLGQRLYFDTRTKSAMIIFGLDDEHHGKTVGFWDWFKDAKLDYK